MKDFSNEMFHAAAREDFKMFVVQVFRELNPGTAFADNWHLDALVHVLEDAIAGNKRRIAINLPPRHLKSLVVSVALPAYLLGMDPSASIICISYGDELALELARQTRRVMQSAWYAKIFPATRLIKSSETSLETDLGGQRYATTVLGQITGKGADFILIDDPTKPADIGKFTGGEKTNLWYQTTLLSRLNDQKLGVIVLVMQRLHVNDLTGFVLAGGGFHHLCLPAIATKDQAIELPDGLVHWRRSGEILHPERQGEGELEELKRQMGSFIFAAQYQQSPEAPDGDMFPRKYIRYVDSLPEKGDCAYWCLGIDAAASTSPTADYTAFVLALVDEGRVTVVQSIRVKRAYEGLKDLLDKFMKKYGDDLMIIIENASAGISLLQNLRSRGVRCKSYNPIDSKLGRAAQMLPRFEDGSVRILSDPDGKRGIKELETELLCFPHGRNDDQVDALMQVVYCSMQCPHGWGKLYEW